MTSSCLWDMPTDPDETLLSDEWYSSPDQVKDTARQIASRTMERLTGMRVGVCPVTIRPQRCLHSVKTGLGYYDLYGAGIVPVLNNGVWMNVNCACAGFCEIKLPPPVGRVDEVKAQGAVLVAGTDYQLLDGYRIVWTGTGDCPFPMRQNPGTGDDQPDTMSVTYLNCYEPDQDGLYAAAVLADEFAAAILGNDCRLPEGVETLVRQGITMTITPGSFPDGKTGIREIDAYLGIWNPHGLSVPPQVWSPEVGNYSTVGG